MNVRLLFILSLIVALGGGACADDDQLECSGQRRSCILFDQFHSRKNNFVDYTLDKSEFNYVGTFSYSRFAAHLSRNDYELKTLRSSRLTKEKLKPFDALFINLVDNTRPDFTDEEVDAIVHFVNEGGGLMVIADHTNVYDHAERINKFLTRMGIEVLFHTVVDTYPDHSVSGKAWVRTSSFREHPVTKEVPEICMQTGAPIKTTNPNDSIALTSNQSYGDFWNKASGPGYYGDWTFVPASSDVKGPLSVVAATQFGKGRVVVAPDQNMFGDPWLFYTGNFQLAANMIEWVAKRENDSPNLRDQPIPGLHIAFDQKHTGYAAGSNSAGLYFDFFVNAHRDAKTTIHGSVEFFPAHVYQFADIKEPIAPQEVEFLKQQMNAGSTIVVQLTPGEISSHTLSFLRTLDSTFSATYDSVPLNFLNDSPFRSTLPGKIEGRFRLTSELGIDFGDQLYSDWTENPNEYPIHDGVQQNDPNQKGALGQENERSAPFFYKTTSTWGRALIALADHEISIARQKEMGEGELIVFLQDGVLRHRSIGYYLQQPTEFNRPQVELHYLFLEYLQRKHKIGDVNVYKIQ